MLGLKDSKDSYCDYEQRSVVTKTKTSKAKEQNLKTINTNAKKSESVPKGVYMSVREEKVSPFKKDGLAASSRVDDRSFDIREEQHLQEKIDEENSVTFYSTPEQNEENSKAFIESLGSWINDLFSVPSKNSTKTSEPQNVKVQKDSVLEEDPEYLKSISAIKEQFRKKLKSETSIQVSVPDRPFVFNFDRVLDSEKKNKKGTKSLPPSPPSDWMEEWTDLDEQISKEQNEANDNSARRYGPSLNSSGLIIRTHDIEDHLKLPPKTKNRFKELNSSILMKERKRGKGKNRIDISELEEYIFPTPSELSKRILLNVNENDKYGKFYKNSHLGVQETQHYCQRKSRSHQTNARCYTTTANPTDSPRNPVQKPSAERISHYCTTAVRGADEILRRNSLDIRKSQLRKPTKKEISEITRDSMTFLKTKASKSMRNVQGDSRADGKTSSDELVKYLMKKIKTTRPHNLKNRGSLNVPQLLGNPKNRFMQSATNTLVSVMAKNDSPLPSKSVTRVLPEAKLYPGKELILKNDSNIRVDVSRAIASSKYSRLSYLLEDNNRIEDDSYSIDKSNFRNSKRAYDDLLKIEVKKNSNKFNKRQEVKNMLSKIDAKFTPFQIAKKQKEQKKKAIEELVNVVENREDPNPRFQKQHEMFKTTLKSAQTNTTNAEPEEAKIEFQEDSNPNSLSTELAVIDTDLQLSPESLQEQIVEEQTTALEQNVDAAIAEFDSKVNELLELDDKTGNQTTEKEGKMLKTKSLQFLKDQESPKIMLSPLEKLCISEQRDIPKTFDPPHCPPDLGQVKPPETFVFNRRYSTNSLNESSPKCKTVAWCNSSSKTPYFPDSEKETNTEKKEAKEKKKVKTPKLPGSKEVNDNACGFEPVKKKPGPNCEKDE